jgi:hypothetical protein
VKIFLKIITSVPGHGRHFNANGFTRGFVRGFTLGFNIFNNFNIDVSSSMFAYVILLQIIHRYMLIAFLLLALLNPIKNFGCDYAFTDIENMRSDRGHQNLILYFFLNGQFGPKTNKKMSKSGQNFLKWVVIKTLTPEVFDTWSFPAASFSAKCGWTRPCLPAATGRPTTRS